MTAARSLSRREREVLDLLTRGLTDQEIGDVLGCTRSTVRCHGEHIRRKLDTTNRVETVVEAIRKGLVEI